MCGIFETVFSRVRRYYYREPTNPDFIRNLDKYFFLSAESVDD